MKKIFIFNGYPMSGKDYVVKMIRGIINVPTSSFSTVDIVKSMMTLIGYDEDDAEIKQSFRAVLSDTKDSIDKHLDNLTLEYAFKSAVEFVDEVDDAFSIIMSREPENITKLVNMGHERGYEVITVFIDSDFREKSELTCHADMNVENYNYSYTFYNTKDPVELSIRINNFYYKYFPKNKI